MSLFCSEWRVYTSLSLDSDSRLAVGFSLPRWMPDTSLETCQRLPQWPVQHPQIAVLPRVSTVVDANSRCLLRGKMAVGSAREPLPARPCIGRHSKNRVVLRGITRDLRWCAPASACRWAPSERSRHYRLTGFQHGHSGRRCRCHQTRHARQGITIPAPTVLP